jgi:hypothetical protein
MNNQTKTSTVLVALVMGFVALAAAFVFNLWGRSAPLELIPPVNPSFTSNSPVRVTYAELVRRGEDLSDFDCYACHDRKEPPPLRFDEQHNLIIPKEHENIVMGHGRHNRNNLCFNCHDEHNLEVFQTRDGRQLKLADSTPLCGSCHGPTYRDWEAGAHGRTSGYWQTAVGPITRLDCVACHNPHSPRFPSRAPAPAPNSLRHKPHSAARI